MKRIITLLLIICCLFSLPIIKANAANEVYSWYCKRNTDHTQPKLDENMKFIEKLVQMVNMKITALQIIFL